jgi:carboxymethylenebutenolidase
VEETVQEEIEIRLPGGVCDAVLCRPAGDGPWPGVMHLTDIGGIRQAQIEMASQLAAQGYFVLAPNLFYRTTRPPVFESWPIAREVMMERMGQLTSPLTPEAVERDASLYVDFLDGRQEVLREAPIGVAGYCYSGAVALRFAAARADRIGAMASFHGGGLFTDNPASPHLVLPRVKARLYFAHAIEDRSMPAEAITAFEKVLADWGGEYESEIYQGAYHSWTTPDSPVYNQVQAARAFAKLTNLFARALHPA